MWIDLQFKVAKNGRKPDLSGMKIGSVFLYCENCGSQRNQFPEFWSRQCPDCRTMNMVHLTVTKEDLK